MVKAEVYRDGKHEGSIEGKLLIAITVTENKDGSMDGGCAICGRGCADDAMWALDKLIATVAGQFGISEHRVLNMLALKRFIDDKESADE